MRLGHHAQILAITVLLTFQLPAVLLGQSPSAEQILGRYRPVHPDVEFDTPDRAEFASCRVEIERGEGRAGFVVYGPAGEVLRRFTDTDGDTKADLFRYYRMGLEVYRDIDSNRNEKPDQHRWMNWGGTRWGIDSNEDGRIDSWRMLSAQEAARIAVEAVIKGDPQALSTVLIDEKDLRELKVSRETGQQLLQSVSDVAGQLRSIASKSRVLNSRTEWVRFDPPVPGLIPAEDGKAGADMIVYENAMAIVQNNGKHELVSIGEMVQVGDVWKLTQLPNPLDSEAAQIQLGGVLMQPQLAGQAVAAAQTMSRDLEELLKQLQAVDEKSPVEGATAAQLAEYNRQRADIIERIIPISPADENRLQWIQQYADGLAAAVQTGEYADGLTRLNALQNQVKSNEELLGYVWYRRLLAEYAVRLKTDDDQERQASQEWWLQQLEIYAKKWPKSEDAADAIVQLAISLELMGRIDDAKNWYGQLVRDHGRSNAGIRAQGALRRLDLNGKPLELSGRSLTGQTVAASQYRGKVLLVAFWASWGTPYIDDLPVLKDTYDKYRAAGFEILGVNLDSNAGAIEPFLRKHGGNWQHIRDAGGMDGPMARSFGIVSVPTMFLVDRNGIVAGGITSENLENAVQSLLKGQRPGTPARQGAAGGPAARN